MNYPDPQQMQQQPQQPQRSSDDTLMLVLCYLGLLSLIPFLARKDSPNIQWHAKQGLTLFAVWFVCWLPMMLLACVPFLNIVIGICMMLLGLTVLATAIFSIVKAVNGEQWKIPIVGDLALKW